MAKISQRAVANAITGLAEAAKDLELVAEWLEVIGSSEDVPTDVRTRALSFGAKVKRQSVRARASLEAINRGMT
jgi:hypothetical protein